MHLSQRCIKAVYVARKTKRVILRRPHPITLTMTHCDRREGDIAILNIAVFCYNNSMLKHICKSQFVRQIMGAIGGTLIALMTYGAYQTVSSVVHAFLDEPSEEQAVDPRPDDPVGRAAQMERDKKIVEIGAHARALLIEQ